MQKETRLFTHRCSRRADFLFQLVQLHFQDFFIWHIPSHPGCESRSIITTNPKLQKPQSLNQSQQRQKSKIRRFYLLNGGILSDQRDVGGLLRASVPSSRLVPLLFLWQICVVLLLLIPADPRCWGFGLRSPIPRDGIKQSGSLTPEQEADSDHLSTNSKTMSF